MTDLLELASRVERLTGPCRETDGDIANALALYPAGWRRGVKEASATAIWFNDKTSQCWSAPSVTASRDAAMTLRLDWMSVEMMESAPEPQFTRCRVWDWRRSPTMSDPGNEWKAEGNRPLPLNICAAILRARAASESPHG